MLWPHAEARDQPEGLRTVHQQQLLGLYAAGVQPLAALDNRQACRAVRHQHAAAVARQLLEPAPEELAVKLLQLHQLLPLVPAQPIAVRLHHDV